MGLGVYLEEGGQEAAGQGSQRRTQLLLKPTAVLPGAEKRITGRQEEPTTVNVPLTWVSQYGASLHFTSLKFQVICFHFWDL
jgi:hypothetical protein